MLGLAFRERAPASRKTPRVQVVRASPHGPMGDIQQAIALPHRPTPRVLPWYARPAANQLPVLTIEQQYLLYRSHLHQTGLPSDPHITYSEWLNLKEDPPPPDDGTWNPVKTALQQYMDATWVRTGARRWGVNYSIPATKFPGRFGDEEPYWNTGPPWVSFNAKQKVTDHRRGDKWARKMYPVMKFLYTLMTP